MKYIDWYVCELDLVYVAILVYVIKVVVSAAASLAVNINGWIIKKQKEGGGGAGEGLNKPKY